MAQSSHSVLPDLGVYWLRVCPSVQILIGYLVWPEYIADPPLSFGSKYIQLVHIILVDSSAVASII